MLLKREYIEYARVRALAQSIIDKEKGVEAFEDFRKTAFPWVDTQNKRDRLEHIKLLEQEVRKGVLGVTPLREGNKAVRSRMKTRIVQADPSAAVKPSADMKKLYAKLGSIVPT